MQYLRKRKVYFALLMILVLIVSMLPSAYAAAESEPNNSFATATVTYDNYDNTGYLSTLSDVDYWCVTFSQDGYANYWLKAPTGCDFDIYLYDSKGTLLEAGDKDAANYQEKIRYNVTAGEKYYIEINTATDTSTSSYLFRAKWYAGETVRVFTTTFNNMNTTATGSSVLPYLWKSGYDGTYYGNNSATSAYNTMPTSDVFVVHMDGNPGNISFYTSSTTETLLVGESYGDMTNHKALSYYTAGALSDVKLAILCATYSGVDNAFYGNLVEMANAKGAKCVIGWNSDLTSTAASTAWLTYFFTEMGSGYNVASCVSTANAKAALYYPDGSSALSKTNILGSTTQYLG